MKSKSLEYYMNLPYKVEIIPEDDGSGFTAVVPELPGCMTCADTIDELWEMVTEAKQLWLEVALENADHIPEPVPFQDEQYSGRFVVRIPRSLHRQLAQRAQWEDTSLNTLVVTVLSDGMGRWGSQLVFEPEPAQAEQPVSALEGPSRVVAGLDIFDVTAQGPWTTAPISVKFFDEAGNILAIATGESASSHEEEPIPAPNWPGAEKRLRPELTPERYKAERLNS